MVGRKKKTKICDIGSEEEWISKLPDDLISEILVHLPTKDAVRTSLLSTRWRNLWQLVPGLDLVSCAFSNTDAFVRFTERFFDSHKESRICRLRLRYDPNGKASLTQWINALTMRTIEHLDLYNPFNNRPCERPLRLYTCVTLVHLRLCSAFLANVEFVSLPCLKILHLYSIKHPPDATVEKLITGSPVLEDLTITSSFRGHDAIKGTIQVRCQSLKRVHIDQNTQVVIDAPLLQRLRAETWATKNFKIINLGFSTKLDLVVSFSEATNSKTLIHGILDDTSRVRDLVIRNICWQYVFRNSEMGHLSRGFSSLYRLNAKFLKSDLQKLPTILESCPKLKSLVLGLNTDSILNKKNREPKVIMFPTLPECLVSSLKFVELKRSVSGYDGEMGLIGFFLKNSTFLKKLILDLYHTKKAKCDFLKELVAMPRCSSSCEVLVL